MKYPKITLRKGKEESLLRFHPWVFSGAIQRLDDGIEEGDTVEVEAADGRLLGLGHFQIGSIAVRMLTDGKSAGAEIDGTFYAARLAEAARLRRRLGLMRHDNNAYRLVHGEGDFLPGLIVDIYGSTAVMQAHSPGMHFARNVIAEALTALPEPRIDAVYYKSETTLDRKSTRLNSSHWS